MHDRIIIACDFPDGDRLRQFLRPFQGRSLFLKIGMELFYREGRGLVEALRADGHRIFLDLKLHDIPHTVHSAIRNLRDLEVDLLTIHAQGGRQMMEAACAAVEGSGTQILAVTLLTSLDQTALREDLDRTDTVAEHAVYLARVARASGVHGCICSPLEAGGIKAAVGRDFVCVTPGIRLSDGTHDDQKRVMTPELALAEGADYLVIGRAITRAEDPYRTYQTLGGYDHA